MNRHPFHDLEPRGKKPSTARALDQWIQAAVEDTGIGAGRLGWMVASGIVIAAIQRTRHEDDRPRFLIKGGAYIELHLGLKARATKDIDTLFRGRFDDLIEFLDEALSEPLDGIAFERTEPDIIELPGRSNQPRRIDVKLLIRGRTWRRIRSAWPASSSPRWIATPRTTCASSPGATTCGVTYRPRFPIDLSPLDPRP